MRILKYPWGSQENDHIAVDDGGGANGNDKVQWTATETGYVTVMIHPYGEDYGGTADLYFNGSLSVSNISFGAHAKQWGQFPCFNCYACQIEDGDQIRTIREPNGATHHQALFLGTFPDGDYADFQSAYSTGDSYYTGGATNTSGSTWNYSQMMYSSLDAADEPAPMSVVLNDLSRDDDGDGIGHNLEYELGTCDDESVTLANGWDCSTYSPVDTDSDGLNDNEELFGGAACDGLDCHWVYLRLWGAKPNHKDVFVEVDYDQAIVDEHTGTDPPDNNLDEIITPSWLSALETKLAAGPAAKVSNPSGDDGVNLHLDLGNGAVEMSTGTNPLVSFDGTVNGGGGGETDSLASCSDKGARFNDSFTPWRKKFFRYACVTTGGGGQASSTYFKAGVGGKGDSSPNAFAHELGHTLSLGHGGWLPADECGSSATSCGSWVNGKPHYRSIMNYVGASDQFYSGLESNGSLVLNPTSVSEVDGLMGESINHLDGGTWQYEVGPNGEVDWNRNGVIDSGSVAAPVTWATWAGTQSHAWSRDLLDDMTQAPVNTPVATRIRVGTNDYLHAFATDGSDIHVWNAPYAEECQIPRNEGNLLNYDGADCQQWSYEGVESISYGVDGVTGTVFGDRVYLATRDNTDYVVVWQWDVAADGTLSNRTIAQDFYPDQATDIPHITFHAGTLHVVWRDLQTGEVRHAEMDSAGNWSQATTALDTDGNPVMSNISPTIAVREDTNELHMVVTSSSDDMSILGFDSVANEWLDTGIQFPNISNKQVYQPLKKVGMAWQPLDRASDWYGDGHWWLVYPDQEDEDKTINLRVEPDGDYLLGSFGNAWYDTRDSSVVFVDDQYQDRYLHAIALRAGEFIEYLPFAGGIADVEIDAREDWSQMGRATCRRLIRYREDAGETHYCGGQQALTSGSIPEYDVDDHDYEF